MTLAIPDQATFFYRGKWMANVDNLLLSNLIRLRGVRPWEVNHIPDSILGEAAAAINVEVAANLT